MMRVLDGIRKWNDKWKAGAFTRTIMSVATFIIAVAFAAQVIQVAVYPEIEAPEIPDVDVNFPSNIEAKGWHQTFKGTDGTVGSDLTDPFYIRGEKAMVTWTPLMDATGTIAYLCPANNTNCADRSIQPDQSEEYDILAGELEIGWYLVRIPDSSGYVEIYLYY